MLPDSFSDFSDTQLIGLGYALKCNGTPVRKRSRGRGREVKTDERYGMA